MKRLKSLMLLFAVIFTCSSCEDKESELVIEYDSIAFDKYDKDGIAHFDKVGGIDTITIMNYGGWNAVVNWPQNKGVKYEESEYPYWGNDIITSWYELRHTEPMTEKGKSRMKIIVKPNDTGKERRDTISISIYTTSRHLIIIQDK